MSITDIWSWLSSNAVNVIALCALAATFWQAYISRKHNRFSVRPHLELANGFNFYKQEYFIDILNNGIGPALVTKIQLFIDDVEVDVKSSLVIKDVISELFHLYKYDQQYMIISDSYMMKPNEHKTFIKVTLKDSVATFPVQGSGEIEAIQKRIRVLVSYKSMYGEKFKCE